MKMFQLAGMALFGTLLLSGCQSSNMQLSTTQTNQAVNLKPELPATQPKQIPVTKITTEPQRNQNLLQYKDLASYGESMGCRAALQEEGTPESDWQQAPKVPGTYQEYLHNWQQGFEKCRIGLGPVQMPVE